MSRPETNIADLNSRLNAVISRLAPAETYLHELQTQLGTPYLCLSETERAYRFGGPGVLHFAFLKAVRAVSGINACIALARGGFNQEISVLIRSVVECCTHAEWATSSLEPGSSHRARVEKHVASYFDDVERSRSWKGATAYMPQKEVHRDIGAYLDRIEREVPASELFSRVYSTSSNYVHARYPETMDMYGGRPGRFHMNGMSGTPKDAESAEIIETYTTTVVQVVAHMALTFARTHGIKCSAIVNAWVRRFLDGVAV